LWQWSDVLPNRGYVFAVAAIAAMALSVAAFYQGKPNGGLYVPPQLVTVTSIDQGTYSYYRYGDSTFTGGCLAIRDSAGWTIFWGVHVDGSHPRPPVPEIDFAQDMVLACILGFVPDCCSARVTITRVTNMGTAYLVSVNRQDRQVQDASPQAVTNPYHFARVATTFGPLVFVDSAGGEPIPDIPVHP
jgi:hypothetical protein